MIDELSCHGPVVSCRLHKLIVNRREKEVFSAMAGKQRLSRGPMSTGGRVEM